MELIFESVEFKNLLSTGDTWIKIDLNSHLSTLITGANGHGKSQMIDAIFFGLFGRAFRKINKSGLVNSRNGKGTEVKIKFKSGSNEYMVHRGIKPNIFNIYCNGVLIDQHAASRDYQQLLEDTVLHMNHKSASQVVILGSATFVPFMQLSAGDRRSVIEDILDIKVFSSMNVLLKNRVAKLKTDYINNEGEIQHCMQTINILKQMIDSERKSQEIDIQIRQESIAKDKATIALYEEQNRLNDEKLKQLQASVSDEPVISEKKTKLQNFKFAFDGKLKKIQDELWFFEENEVCRTCQQDIDEEHKKHVSENNEKKKAEFEEALSKLSNETDTVLKRSVEIQDIYKDMILLGNENTKRMSDIRSMETYIRKLEAEIQTIQNKSQDTTDTKIKLSEAQKQLKKFEDKKKEYGYQTMVYEKTAGLLKDSGIKAQIIKQYLPVINKAVNKYLQDLGFQHSFELDEEFKETIKSHFIDEFSYENFSEGEKQRIDLALLLAWRYVAKLKGSIKTNLLVMDETFDSSMDQSGVDDLMALFKSNFGKETNLFVISHRGDAMLEKFDRHLRFKKVKGYSLMESEK